MSENIQAGESVIKTVVQNERISMPPQPEEKKAPQTSDGGSLYLDAAQVKELVDSGVHFVFFWGLSQAGKTHMLYTIWLCLEQLGSLVPINVTGQIEGLQRSFRHNLNEFIKCKPSPGTAVDLIYAILATFTPNE